MFGFTDQVGLCVVSLSQILPIESLLCCTRFFCARDTTGGPYSKKGLQETPFSEEFAWFPAHI